MNTQKNAYEIRLDLLKIANDNLWQEYYKKLEFFQAAELYRTAGNQAGEAYEKSNEFLPTPEKIQKYAEELYKFVEH